MLDLYKIQELLQQRAEYLARIKLIPYDGSPEVKEINGGKYLYVTQLSQQTFPNKACINEA